MLDPQPLFVGLDRIVTDARFNGVAAADGQTVAPDFSVAGPKEIDRACRLAAEAVEPMRELGDAARAGLLEAIADRIEALGQPLLDRAHLETGLALARLTGERGRTCGQLRLFASEVREGSWMELRVDPALPDRAPLPRPDLRMRKVPLGPVAVFGASNFPLAFSVAGGDTAAALAAGCPVVVKGHPAHPGTSVMVAQAIVEAVQACGFPAGTFSMLSGPGHEIGTALTADPRIMAVGFTGSRAGGLALMQVAANRPVPIPVYAEMSSINPVLLFPAALGERAETLAEGFVGSLTMGAGQFCTNPGLVIAVVGAGLDRFVETAAHTLGQAPSAVMLTPGIRNSYQKGVETLADLTSVGILARGQAQEGQGQAALFTIKATDFLATPQAAHEVFGASSLVVVCEDFAEVRRVLEGLEGQLTATLHLSQADHEIAAPLIPLLERKAGRLLVNGWPTGVEVSHAMVHGGPYPATSDGMSTSVGTLAIQRFLRPVCYQAFPESLLPDVLKPNAVSERPHRFDGVRRPA